MSEHEREHRSHVRPRDLVVALLVLAVALILRQTLLSPPGDGARVGPHAVEPVAERFRTPGIGVGDCLTGSADDVLSEVRVVDCADPHLAEVVAEVAHPGDGRAPYPSTLGWSSFFTAACSDASQDYLGRPAVGSTEVFNHGFVPTPEAWRVADDRAVLCTVEVAFQPDGSREPVAGALGVASFAVG